MKLILKIAAGILLAVVALMVGCSALLASSADEIEQELAVHNPSALTNPNEPAENDEYPNETVAQENARKSATNYLESSAFSRKGLIEQLTYEGYSEADAIYAVDTVDPDWYEQAAKKAANYLESSSFSRQSLYDQLLYEGFSQAEAEHGVGSTGL